MLFSSRLTNRLFLRRLIGLLALLAVLLATCPLPLARKVVKSGETPFPCRACGCGCSTAEQCWTSCCCFSLAERMAWAQQHEVEIPDYILANTDAPPPSERHDAPRACCAKKARPTCCDGDENAKCERNVETSESTDGAVDSVLSENVWVLSLMAVKCQGGATAFTLLPWCILPDVVDDMMVQPSLVEFTPLADEQTLRVFFRPAVPPPRPRANA